ARPAPACRYATTPDPTGCSPPGTRTNKPRAETAATRRPRATTCACVRSFPWIWLQPVLVHAPRVATPFELAMTGETITAFHPSPNRKVEQTQAEALLGPDHRSQTKPPTWRHKCDDRPKAAVDCARLFRARSELHAPERRMHQLAAIDIEAARKDRVLAPVLLGEARHVRQDRRRDRLRRSLRHRARHVGDAEMRDAIHDVGRIFPRGRLGRFEAAALVDGNVH